DELRLLFGSARAELWHLADMASFAMDVQEQRLEFGGEANVVMRAAEAALFAEFEERDSANGAGALIESSKLFSSFADGQVLSQQAGHCGHDFRGIIRRRCQELVRAFFAEMELVGLTIDQVGDVKRGRFIALLAFHDRSLSRANLRP